MLTKDHIVPRTFGGSNDKLNIRKICAECNNKRKAQMTLTEMLDVGKKPPLTIFTPVKTIPLEEFRQSMAVMKSFQVASHYWLTSKKDRREYRKAMRSFVYT